MKKFRVLYIDDEVHNLNAFKASFRRRYEIFTTTRVPEARKILEQHDIPIIIADQRMPGTTGIQFFNSIKKLYPDSVRILITAYTEVESLVDAINKGQIYRFVKKPWDYYDLQNTITNAYDIYQTRKELDLKLRGIHRNLEERKQFINHISKDIQGLLYSSLGVVNLAQTDPSLNGAGEYFDVLGENLIQLKDFVRQMVGYYKNTDTLLKVKNIDFQELIQEVLQEFAPGDEMDIEFRVEVHQDRSFLGDGFRIRTILSNLISNAERFRAEERTGLIELSARIDEKGARLDISDNGIGIDQKDVGKIFDLFFKTSHAEAGSGIGLYVVHGAVSRMNGTIEVSSKVGEGTSFVIHLPHREV